MELVPYERAVLKQVLDLFLEASVRILPINALTSRWQQADYEAYRAGYDGLARKALIAKSTDERQFCITNAGMKAFLQIEVAEAA